MGITKCSPDPDFSNDLHYLNEYEFFDEDSGEDESSNCAETLLSNEHPFVYSTPGPSLEDFKFDDEGTIYADGHAIRLLRLIGGTGPICASLFKAYIHNSGDGLNGMPYEALSYTWGSVERTKYIIMDGKRFKITANLYSALKYVRCANEDRILWIDAVCINQDQTAERNHQVSHMASIYRDAERVLFWLGEPTYETNTLMSTLKRSQITTWDNPSAAGSIVDTQRGQTLSIEEHSYFEDHNLLFQGLESLLKRPWFRRSWILQEVCHAKTAVVICGTKSVPAHVFALAPSSLRLKLEPHCKAVLEMMPGATRSTREFLSGREIRNFYSLLRRFHNSEATEPKDQIYALLSMASDADMPGFPKVEYERSFETIIGIVYEYLFPKSWYQCGGTHNFRTLSEFVGHFPRLREIDIQAEGNDLVSRAKLSDDTEFAQLDLQQAFRKAVQNGDFRLVQNLLHFRNVDVNSRYESGQTPLSWAAVQGHDAVVKQLLEAKADIETRDVLGRTPLSWAAGQGHDAVIKQLLDAKANIETGDKDGQTPLSWAAGRGHDAVVKQLLDAKAEIETRDEYGRTPLSRAAEQGHDAVVKQLLDAKADIETGDKDGRTPLSRAAGQGHGAVVKQLLEAKANIETGDRGESQHRDKRIKTVGRRSRGQQGKATAQWSSSCSTRKPTSRQDMNTVGRRSYW